MNKDLAFHSLHQNARTLVTQASKSIYSFYTGFRFWGASNSMVTSFDRGLRGWFTSFYHGRDVSLFAPVFSASWSCFAGKEEIKGLGRWERSAEAEGRGEEKCEDSGKLHIG
jgi:hypothetical protein